MPDSSSIRVLTDAVANQIAAGEVIQRPASVVKELMENAVDAGARVIHVEVKDAGKTLIRVTDNGTGMSETDATLCFERHATSKISRAEDLFTIATKGFRGEALASVAAVSEVEMKTRRKEDELGTRIRMAGSRTEQVEAVQAPAGTTLQVKNLFFNIPARRKFLKSDHTELRHIINEFNHVALTHPDIQCTLMHNGTEVLHLPPANLRQRIVGIFGKSVNSYLLPLETETSLITIRGFIGKPEHARKSYGEQFFFVNQRYIRHPYFHKAVMGGYEQILAPDHIPSYFLYLESEPSQIDVNIHPAKTEVKFEDERSIWQILHAAVRESIGKHSLSPSLDFDREGVIDIPVLRSDTEVRTPVVETNPEYNPFEEEKSTSQYRARQPYRDERFEGWEQLFEPSPEPRSGQWLQVKNKYILSPVKSGLMIIDQHRAHERILYEQFLHSGKDGRPVSQQSLFPETVHLNPEDYQACLEMREDLEQWGFDIRDLGHRSVVVHGVPADTDVPSGGVPLLLEEMIGRFKELKTNNHINHRDRLARSAARSSAIGYGRSLTGNEMQELTDQLFACSDPHYTPSGKTIVSILEIGELDNQFKS